MLENAGLEKAGLEKAEIKSGERNSIRFNQYISWDIKLNRSWQIKQQTLRIEAGITNLLDRDNQVGVDYELKDNTLSSNHKTGLPLAPFLDLYWQF